MHFVIHLLFLTFALTCTLSPVSHISNSLSSDLARTNENQQPTFQSNEETVTVKNVVLELKDCELTYKVGDKSESIKFDFPKPCSFSRDNKGSIRQVKTARNTTTLAVEGSRKKDETNTGDCETYVRGIVIGRNSVNLSTNTQKIASCLPNIWDEKMFKNFAVKTEPLNSAARHKR